MRRLGLWCDLRNSRRCYKYICSDGANCDSSIFSYLELNSQNYKSKYYQELAFIKSDPRYTSVADLIFKLIKRYISIYQINMRVDEYNELAYLLAKRYSGNPAATYRSINAHGPVNRIIGTFKGDNRPVSRFEGRRAEVSERLKRRRIWVLENFEKCDVCGVLVEKNHYNRSVSIRNIWELSGSNKRARNWVSKNMVSNGAEIYSTCLPCHKSIAKKLKIMTEVESIKSDIKMLKNEIKQS